MVDEVILKRIGYWILTMLGLLSTLLLEWMSQLSLSPYWIVFITGGWIATLALVEEIIRLYFKIPKEEVSVEEPPVTPTPP